VAAFTKISFSGKIDSKGRITVPSRIRNRLDLEKGDKVSLQLNSSKVVRKSFDSKVEALNYISTLSSVESFSFEDGVLEVVLDG